MKGSALAVALLSFGATAISLSAEGSLFYDAYKVDFFSQLFKLLITFSALIVVMVDRGLPGIKAEIRAEYYLFLFMSVLGLVMLVSSVELISIFIALELSSFAVYVMVPLRSGGGNFSLQSEAAIKYLLFGVTATGFMLFGMSYMYGLTGSTSLAVIVDKLTYLYNQPAALVAIVMVLCGFFYKIALFPFHFWVPDVYQGSANETTTFIATVPKLAAVALLLRITTMVNVDGQAIVGVLMIVSLASMFYGNLSALVQKDLKRMLGFSGIAHAGFVLFGLLTFNITGYSNGFYYIIGYVFMNLGCFLVICQISKDGENLLIEDLKGLHKRSPLFALTLLVALFSLAGIPPFVGFTGKFMLLLGALKQDYLIPVVLAAFNTAIAIYYYLSVVRVAYCSDPEGEYEGIKASFGMTLTSIMLIGVMLFMGLFPGIVLDVCAKAVKVIM